MNTRKKSCKIDYGDKDNNNEDFSDSASEAEIPQTSSSEEEMSSDEEFTKVGKVKRCNSIGSNSNSIHKGIVGNKKKGQFTAKFLSRLAQQNNIQSEINEDPVPTITVKDLTEEDKLLPAVLNLSESGCMPFAIPETEIKTQEDDSVPPLYYPKRHISTVTCDHNIQVYLDECSDDLDIKKNIAATMSSAGTRVQSISPKPEPENSVGISSSTEIEIARHFGRIVQQKLLNVPNKNINSVMIKILEIFEEFGK